MRDWYNIRIYIYIYLSKYTRVDMCLQWLVWVFQPEKQNLSWARARKYLRYCMFVYIPCHGSNWPPLARCREDSRRFWPIWGVKVLSVLLAWMRVQTNRRPWDLSKTEGIWFGRMIRPQWSHMEHEEKQEWDKSNWKSDWKSTKSKFQGGLA